MGDVVVRGRIRTIKPELFKDEDLWDLAQETGLPILQGFEGLWCYADKEGRFEWRPRQLKTDILPYWEGDFSRVLDALTTRGFVVKYAVSGREYGLVRTFKKHQVINNRESDSELPAPPAESTAPSVVTGTSTREARVPDASSTREEHAQAEGKGTEGNGKGTDPTRTEAREGGGVDSEPKQPVECTAAAPAPERAPAPPSGSGGAWQEVELGFSSAYSAASVGKMPVLLQGKRDAAVEHCRGLAKMYHKPLYDVAQAVCTAAKPGSKSWVHEIAQVDPYAPAPQQTGAFPARAGRMAPSRGTTAEDYRDAPSLAEQRAEAQRRRAAANGT